MTALESSRSWRSVILGWCVASLVGMRSPPALGQDGGATTTPATSATSTESEPPTTESVPQESPSAPGDPWGDGDGTRIGPLGLRTLVQVRYATTFADPSTNPRTDYVVRENYLARQGDGWKLNRLFLRMTIDPTPYLGLKAILDFSELAAGHTTSTVKQAYTTLRPFESAHFEVLAGIMKLPFSTMELDPIAEFELANLGISDDLIKDLGFGGRDLGAQVVYSPFSKARWLTAVVGAFGGHAEDEHASPVGTISARLESRPLKGLRLGVDGAVQPRDLEYKRPFDTSSKDVLPNPPDPFYPTAKYWRKGNAASADVSFDRYHFDARAEVMAGDRTDVMNAYGAQRFMAGWALLAYRFKLGPLKLRPAIRAEWLDADATRQGGVRRQVSVALGLWHTKNVLFLLDATHVDVEKNSPLLDPPTPLQTDPYLELSRTVGTVQLQVRL